MTPDRQSGRGTDRHSIRLPRDDWDALEQAAHRVGFANRSDYLQAFADWALRKPGAKAPRRPAAHDEPASA